MPLKEKEYQEILAEKKAARKSELAAAGVSKDVAEIVVAIEELTRAVERKNG